MEHLANVVGEACLRLSAANIPHNLFVVDCGQRVFLFPNAFARAKAHGEVPSDLLDSQVRRLVCSSVAADMIVYQWQLHVSLLAARRYLVSYVSMLSLVCTSCLLHQESKVV